jgi:hypothetical protein
MRAARMFAVIISIAAFCAPLAAIAQQVPGPAPAAAAPSYAKPNNRNGEETIQGRVAAYDGKYALTLQDDRGFADTVELHQGTVINPTGMRLEPGMRATIIGYNRGRVFAANEIDTPYQAYGFEPYPYPYYPYPVYPTFSIGIGFGSEFHHHWH